MWLHLNKHVSLESHSKSRYILLVYYHDIVGSPLLLSPLMYMHYKTFSICVALNAYYQHHIMTIPVYLT